MSNSNPDVYILLRSLDSLSDEDGISWFSNLDYGKAQAVKCVSQHSPKYTIYKLVPVFEASLEVSTKVIEKDLTQS